tara:strand:- start:380 stop:1714 length:1335 start_codon:yes stop_codon:yes gene_type:complete
MARFFDSLRDPTEGEELLDQSYGLLDDPETQLDETSDINYTAEYNNLPLITANNEAEAGYLVQSGFIEGEKTEQGLRTFVAPSRRMSERLAQREQLRQAARKKLYQEQQNSTLFKIGDTLADTGRLFMSPIFWLSGEDTTKYDPSAQRDAKYRAAFDAHEQFQSALYDKLVQNRMQRIKYARDLRSADITDLKNTRELNAPLSADMKQMYEYAVQTQQKDLWDAQTPEAFTQLSNQMGIADGSKIRWQNRVVAQNSLDKVTGIGDKYETRAATVKEAFAGYRSLREAINAQSGIGDIAAIFSFMKSLDPRSVVREGEFAMAGQAGGVWQDLQNTVNRLQTGQRLTPKVRGEILALANRLIGHWEDAEQSLYENYSRKVTSYDDFNDDASVTALLGSRPVKVSSLDYGDGGNGNIPPPGGGTGTIVIDDGSEENNLMDLYGGTPD